MVGLAEANKKSFDSAWQALARGDITTASKHFALSTSRVNSDFVYFVYHYLRGIGQEVFQAPYFAGSQISHFEQTGVVDVVFGPPGLFLFGVSKVINNIDFVRGTFDWVDFENCSKQWEINRNQFIDACLLAGTEYCLTYPYLNIDRMSANGGQGEFSFDAAIEFIKQAPMAN